MWCIFSQSEFVGLSLQILETTSFSWLGAGTELILTDTIWNREKLLFSLGNLGKTLDILFVRKRTDLNLPLFF